VTDVMDQQPKQPKKKSDLLVRCLSSILLGPPVLAAVYYGSPYSDVLIFLCAIILAWEWATICGEGSLGLPGKLLILSIAIVMGMGAAGYFFIALWGIAALAVTLWFLIRILLKQVKDTNWYLLGFIYVSISSLALLWLRNNHEDGLNIIFWILFVVWATDIGAYFSGRNFGGPKIAPKISPKKTWSGLVGGMMSAAVISYVFAQWMVNVSPFVLATTGALLAVVSQAGDFFESHLKRKFDVKDSSKLIPGHGGLLDRVDGLLACAIVVAGFYIV